MFQFKAVLSTDDGRLTKGQIYRGSFVYKGNTGYGGLRIVVWDNKQQWMTFKPLAFEPILQSPASTDSQG